MARSGSYLLLFYVPEAFAIRDSSHVRVWLSYLLAWISAVPKCGRQPQALSWPAAVSRRTAPKRERRERCAQDHAKNPILPSHPRQPPPPNCRRQSPVPVTLLLARFELKMVVAVIDHHHGPPKQKAVRLGARMRGHRVAADVYVLPHHVRRSRKRRRIL